MSYYDDAEDDPTLADIWEDYDPIPPPGENDALDAFLERKHLDHGALIRVGARLANPLEVAYIGPGYIKYRHLETGRRRSMPGSSYPRMRVVPAQHAAEPSTVIVAEGETDAARLTMLYPSANVAILPAGAKYVPPAYGEQVRVFDRVLASFDRDEAGDEGWQKFHEHVPHAVRFLPPDVNDWCELNGAEPPPLPEVQAPTAWPHLVELDVRRMLTEQPPPIEWVVHPLFARGFFTMIAGREGRGKSLVALALGAAMTVGADVADFRSGEGYRCLYLDAENGLRVAHRRLHGMDLDPDRFRYFDASGWNASEYLSEVELLLAEWPADFIVFDSLTALAGKFDDRDTADNERVLRPLQRMAQHRHISVCVLHHSPKYGAEYRGDTGMGAIVDIGWNIARHDDDPQHQRRRQMVNWKMRADEQAEDYWLSIERDGTGAKLLAAPAWNPKEEEDEKPGDVPI